MLISDWSSEVCSSDLRVQARHRCRHLRDFRIGSIAVAFRGAKDPELLKPSKCGGFVIADRLVRQPTTKDIVLAVRERSEEHTSELQSLMRISYAVFCLKKKKKTHQE